MKPKDKPYKVSDFQKLYVTVAPSGLRLWHMKYRIDGREKRLSFGAYPSVSLAQARKLPGRPLQNSLPRPPLAFLALTGLFFIMFLTKSFVPRCSGRICGDRLRWFPEPAPSGPAALDHLSCPPPPVAPVAGPRSFGQWSRRIERVCACHQLWRSVMRDISGILARNMSRLRVISGRERSRAITTMRERR